MKFNKWTLGLAAVGVVSLASAARADEKPSAVQTALSNTTISGYVSTSMNVGLTDNYNQSPAAQIPFQAGKANGFNLDVVKLSIAKPEDESPWASGYQVDLLFGPDAVGYNTTVNSTATQVPSSDFGIKQAYVTLRTPVGNGIDWKLGVFDSPLGYEVFDAGSNPNYTRSYGYANEPTELTGLQASYKVSDALSLSGGVANTSYAGINNRNNNNNDPVGSVWHKAYFGDVTLTAPSSWGSLAGSTAFAGILYGAANTANDPNTYASGHMGGNQVNYYAGLTLNTPWKELTGGVAFDYVRNEWGGEAGAINYDTMALGLYGTYKATDKLSFNFRGEYLNDTTSFEYASAPEWNPSYTAVELTGTVEYDLWANVTSRVEIRYDKIIEGLNIAPVDVADNSHSESLGIYANVIYKF